MSVGTGTAAIGPAAAEAAALLCSSLGIEAEAGAVFELWGPPPPQLGEMGAKGSTTWSAALMGPFGHCGDIALVLPTGANVPGEGRVASALAGAVPALSEPSGTENLGQMQRSDLAKLLEARPGQHGVGVPLMSAEGWAGLMVVITNPAAAELPHLDPAPGPAAVHRSIASLGDVEMTVSVELGRTKVPIKDLLTIHNGSVVQLDRPVSHPVDIFVHGTLIARGEVVVVDECFAVRVTELLTGD